MFRLDITGIVGVTLWLDFALYIHLICCTEYDAVRGKDQHACSAWTWTFVKKIDMYNVNENTHHLSRYIASHFRNLIFLVFFLFNSDDKLIFYHFVFENFFTQINTSYDVFEVTSSLEVESSAVWWSMQELLCSKFFIYVFLQQFKYIDLLRYCSHCKFWDYSKQRYKVHGWLFLCIP